MDILNIIQLSSTKQVDALKRTPGVKGVYRGTGAMALSNSWTPIF